MLETNVKNISEKINPMYTEKQKPKEMISENKSKIKK